MTSATLKRRNTQSPFWSVSIGHFTVDLFNGMAPVLLVFLSGHFMPLTNTQIGVAVSAYQLLGAVGQPLFGWLGDRNGGRLLGAGGVAWTVAMLMLALLTAQATGQFELMLIPYVLASLGSSAFHPVGAMHAAQTSAKRAATNTSLFFLAGQVGLAAGPGLAGFLLDRVATHNNLMFTQPLGPAYAGQLIERASLTPIFVLALLAAPAVFYMAVAIPSLQRHLAGRAAETTPQTSGASRLSLPVKAILLLAVVVALRSLINPGVVAFIPRLFQSKGWDPTAYGFVTSFFWLGGGLSGVLVGYLADRWDSRWLVAITLCLSAPMLFLLANLDSALAFGLALLTGALSGGSHSLLVVQAQRLIPGRKGFASGAILGFMFGTGALGSLLIGTMSDRIGLEGAFQIIAVITVFTGILGLALPPDERPVRETQQSGPAEAVVSGAD